jgi:hypothetical protein
VRGLALENADAEKRPSKEGSYTLGLIEMIVDAR